MPPADSQAQRFSVSIVSGIVTVIEQVGDDATAWQAVLVFAVLHKSPSSPWIVPDEGNAEPILEDVAAIASENDA
jgi:hypothetical protein